MDDSRLDEVTVEHGIQPATCQFGRLHDIEFDSSEVAKLSLLHAWYDLFWYV